MSNIRYNMVQNNFVDNSFVVRVLEGSNYQEEKLDCLIIYLCTLRTVSLVD